MKALIDTNVLVDVIQSREPFYSDSKRVFQLVIENKIEGYISVQTLKDIFYICKRSKIKKNPIETIEQIIFIFKIIDATGEDAISALMSDIEDFEDGMLVFSAQRNGIDTIITRNEKDHYESELTIIDPKEINQYLNTLVETGSNIIG
ncbi:MAG: PIN domain-containing protein [Candidatus Methanoplasma sp.]|jgi:predicted nucleic acid-binding protein|nr:PIN domain-containing protein [Candidatus Methanoplasma sp.]